MCTESEATQGVTMLLWCLQNNRINTEWVYMYAQQGETGSVPHSYTACVGDQPCRRLLRMSACQAAMAV